MATKKKGAKKGGAKKRGAKKSVRKAAKKSTRKAARRAAPKKRAKRTPNAAFLRPVQPDETLGAIVGMSPLPRTELTKKIWQYIKRNDLQDKKERRNINADEKLGRLFGGKKQVSMFELTKLVSKHVK